jgi:N-acetylglucosamine PTS system EIICBA or EIICB component
MKFRSRLLEYIGGGRGLAVILISLLSIVLAIVAGLIWPYVQDVFNALGKRLGETGAIGAGLYGVFNRIANYVWSPPRHPHVHPARIWNLPRSTRCRDGRPQPLLRGRPHDGGYMAGMFPITMFGLPGAALPMILAAKPERRGVVTGVLGSAAAFLTGLAEPIEFVFMFLAPILFVFHAVLH